MLAHILTCLRHLGVEEAELLCVDSFPGIVPFNGLGQMPYIAESGKVIYRSKMSHGRNKRNFKIFDAEEFIAAITQHIPEMGFQLLPYYGWYSNRMRGSG